MAPPAARPRRDDEPTDRFPRIEPDVRDTGPRYAGPPQHPDLQRPDPQRPDPQRADLHRPDTQRRGRYQPEPDERDWDYGQHERTRQQLPVTGPSASTTMTPPPPVRFPARPAGPDDDDLDGGYDEQDDGYGGEEFDGDYDEYDEDAELDEDEESPAKEWVLMVTQLAIGAIGGAALWLGFQWLWRFMPVAAFVAALLVIIALVGVVRRIRRADDLQSTVVTVLVGLFVTVSPAALLLLDS